VGDSGTQIADLKLLIQRLSIYTGTAILVLAVGWGVCGSARKPGHAGGIPYRIVSVTYGEPFRYPQSYGDTWIPTWAGDGHIYTTADDNDGIYSTKPTEDGSCHPGSNLSIVTLKDFSPFQGSFAGGVNRNCMRQGDWNYGSCCEAGTTGYVPPPQGATTTASSWKAVGLICLPDESNQDVLYLSVSLHAMDRTWERKQSRRRSTRRRRSTSHARFRMARILQPLTLILARRWLAWDEWENLRRSSSKVLPPGRSQRTSKSH